MVDTNEQQTNSQVNQRQARWERVQLPDGRWVLVPVEKK
jgi:hypothetical protein